MATILTAMVVTVAPVRERGLKFPMLTGNMSYLIVAPVRERGLKSIF